MKGSKTVKKLALNEMLQALEEPQKELGFEGIPVVFGEEGGQDGYVALKLGIALILPGTVHCTAPTNRFGA